MPSHSYQLSFESWTKWDSFFAGSSEILEYWKRIVDKYNLRKRIRFQHQCIGARWSETSLKWGIQVLDLQTGHRREDTADVLMTGEGVLNAWKWPDIDGLHSFQGTLLHSAAWDANFDPKDKRVAVIGAGSSGIQIVPALEPQVQHMDHYIRGRMWISNAQGEDEAKKHTGNSGHNFSYIEDQKQAWGKDRESYLEYRRSLEVVMQSRISFTMAGSEAQAKARAQFAGDMEKKLQTKPGLAKMLTPTTFSPLCKRLNPGPGYLEALTSPKVDVVLTAISHVDKRGIITTDGVHHPTDAIVCATGFQTAPGAERFPIIGRSGMNLREKYAESPRTYLGLCTDDFPNFFQSLGPNTFQGAGNLLIMIEATHKYVGQILEKLAYENVGTIEPKVRPVDLFTRHCDEYFKRTVYSEVCDSWYKSSPPGATREERRRGRVTAIWPGSGLHALRALKSVRWEDFEMRSYNDNDFGWFGNGLTTADLEGPDKDPRSFSWYLDDTMILG